MMKPCNWVEEDREDVVCEIVDSIVSRMTLEQMRSLVWDVQYEDVVWLSWEELWALAEDYCPELLDRFQDPADSEISQ